MKKKLLFPCLLLTAAMLFACLLTFGVSAKTVTMTDVAAGEAVAAGDIVTISNEAELKAFSKYVSDGGLTEGVTFRLENDIELSFNATKYSGQYLTTLNPIGGTYNGASANVAFKGTFDGNGKTISNFNVTTSYVDASGANARDTKAVIGALFAAVDGGTVKDLTLGVYQIAQVGGVNGAIAATATGATFLNCSVIADTIEAANPTTQTNQINLTKNTVASLGGIVGYAKDSVIDGCNVNVAIKGYQVVAGIVGTAENTVVRNCVVGGTYTNTQNSIVGGVAGELTGTSSVKNCYSSASLSGKGTLGGVVGAVGADAVVENCFSSANVATAATITSGSLVGINNGTVKHSFGLRSVDKTRFDAHADIAQQNGKVENIYAYQAITEGETTVFTVGTITPEQKDINCWDAPHMGGTCTADEPGCGVCNQGLLSLWVYDFVPSEDAAIANLADALNAWVAENDDADYAAWVVSGGTIVNCKHGTLEYVAHAGEAPTCVDDGHGDLVCALCGMVAEADVTIPANPEAHASADGKTYACVSFECVYCEKLIEATAEHLINATLACKEQTCSRCHSTVAPTASHTHPEGFDETKPCAEYICTVCNVKVHDVEHSLPSYFAPCQDVTCSVCQLVVQQGNGMHAPGLAPNCTRSQYCMDCGKLIQAAQGHKWGDPANCGYAQICTVCDIPNPDAPATGEHVPSPDMPESTCTEDCYCTVCNLVIEPAKRHPLADRVGTIDCGHGVTCGLCLAVVEDATGEHTVDWTDVTVVRPATKDRTGIVITHCLDCDRELEGYITCSASDEGLLAIVTVDGEEVYFYVGTTVQVTLGKIADYKTLAYADGYIPMQVITVSIVDAAGEKVAVDGAFAMSLILNKSVAQMDSAKLKLYAVNGETLTEIAIGGIADGYISFTASADGTFVIAGERAAALTLFGTVNNPVKTAKETAAAQPVAALVGTYLYDKKDDEI